jgi:hypothetical protein
MTKTLCGTACILGNGDSPLFTASPIASAFGSNLDSHPSIGTEMLRSDFTLDVRSQSGELELRITKTASKSPLPEWVMERRQASPFQHSHKADG